jgi:hypothetical protein
MSEQAQNEERVAIQAVAAVLGDSLKKVASADESQQIAILGTAAIVACLPGVADIPRDRLAAVVGILSQGRSEEFRKRIVQFIGMSVTVSERLPDIVAKAKAARAKKKN